MKGKIKNRLVVILVGLLVITCIFGLAYLGIYIKKSVSYNLIYKDKVEETIREMVKPEYLNN